MALFHALKRRTRRRHRLLLSGELLTVRQSIALELRRIRTSLKDTTKIRDCYTADSVSFKLSFLV
jgi:hypothetical protein